MQTGNPKAMNHSPLENRAISLSSENGQPLLRHVHGQEHASHDSLRSARSDDDKEAEKKKSPCSSWPLLWKIELLTWLGSVCCFLGIVIVLATLNNKGPPDWYFESTPNAVIQLLATFAQALLMASVSAAIGQMKWLRMLQERPQVDFHRLDQSSRGPWGSLLVLISRRAGFIASLGALIMVLSLGIAPCFQQTLRCHTVYTAGSDASVPIARYMNGTGTGTVYQKNIFVPRLDPQLASTPYIALFSPPHTEYTATAHCGSGNCTWEVYETLAVCNTCKDLSSSLSSTKHDGSNDNNLYTLPNGFEFAGGPVIARMNITTSVNAKSQRLVPVPYKVPGMLGTQRLETTYWDSIEFGNNGSRLLGVFAVGASQIAGPNQPDKPLLSMPDLNFAPPVAYECLLQFCVREVRASWTNSTFHETVVSSWTNQTQTCQDLPCYDPYTFTSPKTGTTFHVQNDALTSKMYWLSFFLRGNATSFGPQGISFSSDFAEAIYKAMNSSDTSFTSLMDNLANRLSLNLREIPYQPVVVGQSVTALYLAYVRWVWLTLPVFELVAGLFFLVTTMVETKRRGMAPWRNGILASLFHGFDHGLVPRGSGHILEEEARPMTGASFPSIINMEDLQINGDAEKRFGAMPVTIETGFAAMPRLTPPISCVHSLWPVSCISPDLSAEPYLFIGLFDWPLLLVIVIHCIRQSSLRLEPVGLARVEAAFSTGGGGGGPGEAALIEMIFDLDFTDDGTRISQILVFVDTCESTRVLEQILAKAGEEAA
ncbi:hypothetical protein PG994_012495 [Apiospora phragmitis]|uniref:Uncharacterized protein n=1 Tax=Apiospora phragmitis TaxID=2905665 RepID=A0ABR1TY25_9PEZI